MVLFRSLASPIPLVWVFSSPAYCHEHSKAPLNPPERIRAVGEQQWLSLVSPEKGETGVTSCRRQALTRFRKASEMDCRSSDERTKILIALSLTQCHHMQRYGDAGTDSTLGFPDASACNLTKAYDMLDMLTDVMAERATNPSGSQLKILELAQDIDAITHSCTSKMSDAVWGVYTQFLNHFDNICYYLYSTVWQERTEDLVGRLAYASGKVVQKLEDIDVRHARLLQQQSIALEHQKRLLHGSQLIQETLDTSQTSLQASLSKMHENVQQEQSRLRSAFDEAFALISRLVHLQQTILGRLFDFESMIIYSGLIVLTFYLTASEATRSARPGLYIGWTLMFIVELAIWRLLDAVVASGFVSASSFTVRTVIRKWRCACLSTGTTYWIVSWWRYREPTEAVVAALTQGFEEIKAQLMSQQSALSLSARSNLESASLCLPSPRKSMVKCEPDDSDVEEVTPEAIVSNAMVRSRSAVALRRSPRAAHRARAESLCDRRRASHTDADLSSPTASTESDGSDSSGYHGHILRQLQASHSGRATASILPVRRGDDESDGDVASGPVETLDIPQPFASSDGCGGSSRDDLATLVFRGNAPVRGLFVRSTEQTRCHSVIQRSGRTQRHSLRRKLSLPPPRQSGLRVVSTLHASESASRKRKRSVDSDELEPPVGQENTVREQKDRMSIDEIVEQTLGLSSRRARLPRLGLHLLRQREASDDSSTPRAGSGTESVTEGLSFRDGSHFSAAAEKPQRDSPVVIHNPRQTRIFASSKWMPPRVSSQFTPRFPDETLPAQSQDAEIEGAADLPSITTQTSTTAGPPSAGESSDAGLPVVKVEVRTRRRAAPKAALPKQVRPRSRQVKAPERETPSAVSADPPPPRPKRAPRRRVEEPGAAITERAVPGSAIRRRGRVAATQNRSELQAETLIVPPTPQSRRGQARRGRGAAAATSRAKAS